MKPSIKSLGEKIESRVITSTGIKFGIKSYEQGVRIATRKQNIILKNEDLHPIMSHLIHIKKINLFQPHIFTLLKEKFPTEKEIHQYIDHLTTNKPPYFEEHQKIMKERKTLEEL